MFLDLPWLLSKEKHFASLFYIPEVYTNVSNPNPNNANISETRWDVSVIYQLKYAIL